MITAPAPTASSPVTIVDEPAERSAGTPKLLELSNRPEEGAAYTLTNAGQREAHIAGALSTALPGAASDPRRVALVRQISQTLSRVDSTELDLGLQRAHQRDFVIALLEGVFKDGIPGAAVALAMNLAGTKALQHGTSSDMALAASYGAMVGAAGVILGHLLRDWFANARYTAWPEAAQRVASDLCPDGWTPPDVTTAHYLAAVVIPPTVRNMIRTAAACTLAGLHRSELAPMVDNVLETAGGVMSSAATALRLASLRRRIGTAQGGFFYLRADAPDQIDQLHAGHASFLAGLGRHTAAVARQLAGNVPGAVRALATPSGLAEIGVLVSGVMLSTLVAGAIDDAMADEPAAGSAAAMGAARATVLAATYAGLAVAASSASRAANLLVLGIRNLHGETPRFP
jgi:hypothetical protein